MKLQRSDDDAENALWVCSNAGAAQRHHPSEQNGGKRVRATPTPHTPTGLLAVDLPTKTSLAPEDPLKFSENIGYSKKHNCWQVCCLHEESVSLAHAFSFPNGPFSHWLNIPLKSPSLWDKLGVECEPVWCCSGSAGGCWSAVASPGHWSGAQRKMAQGHAGGVMVHWGEVSEQTRTARSRLLRLHYRGQHSHGMSGILGYKMWRIHMIWLQILVCLSHS